MKRIAQFVRTTLAGGILFLVPIVVIVVIFQKALALAQKLVTPLAERLPFESVVGLNVPVVLAVSVLVLFCLLAGLLARTKFAKRVVSSLESTVLFNIPGYYFFKSMGEGLLHVEPATPQRLVVVHIDECWHFGLQTETLENGLVAVYVPDAPNPASGSVHLVTSDRVTQTTIPPNDALKCMKRLGAGSNALLRGLELKGHGGEVP